MIDVLVIGSANLDLVAGAGRIPRPGETVLGTSYAEHAGGKGLNQVVAAARAGATTAMVGALGDDAAGTALRAVMRAEGVDDALVATVDAPTGRALITVSDDGENSIVVVPGANALVRAPDPLPPARVVLAQLEVPVDAVRDAFAAARAHGATTVLNPAPAMPLPSDLLALCDVVVPNQHEVDLLGGVDALRAAGVGHVIVTLGADGADVVGPDGTRRQSSFTVSPVDTTGAGDAFCGALGARLAAGDPVGDAVAFAVAAGALATTVAGAVPSLPRRDAVDELLGRQ